MKSHLKLRLSIYSKSFIQNLGFIQNFRFFYLMYNYLINQIIHHHLMLYSSHQLTCFAHQLMRRDLYQGQCNAKYTKVARIVSNSR